MIFDAIGTAVADIIIFFLGYFPDVHFSEDIVLGISSILDLFENVAFIVPMGTVMIAFVWWITLSNMHIVASIINWLIRKVPTIS